MENYNNMKEIFLEEINKSDLKTMIYFEESELITSKIEKTFKISGRVPKIQQEALFNFKENLINKLNEKIGANFVSENFETIWQVGCGITVGDTFPSIELFGLTGNKLNFSPDPTKLTLIDFWNINCQFCKPLMEKYVRFSEAKKQTFNFEIVGISNDKNNQDWKKFVASQKWQIIPQYVKAGVTDSLGIVGVPFIIIVKNKEVIFADRAYKINVEATLEKGELQFTKEYSLEDSGNVSVVSKSSVEKLQIVDEINQLFKNDGMNEINFSISLKSFYLSQKEFRKGFAKISGSRFKFDDEKFEKILKTISQTYGFNEISQDVKVTESLVIDTNDDF